jgi:hypothetical protein
VAFAKPALHGLWGRLHAFCTPKSGPLYIVNIGINAFFKEFAKNIKKILEKVCTYQNYAYLCIRNQEISSYKAMRAARFAEVEKENLKKVCKKFLKNLVVKKKGLTFAPLSASKLRKRFFKRFFDLLVI